MRPAVSAVQGQHPKWCFTWKGKRMESIGTAWKGTLARADIQNFYCYRLRHTRASWPVMNRTSLQALMETGGWKSYGMVLRHAHLAPDHLADAAARIEKPLETVVSNSTISLR